MTRRRITFPGFSVSVAAGWEDITDTVAGDDRPFTIARRDDGLGAMQFSVALYRTGPKPSPSEDDLSEMAAAFGKSRQLGMAFDPVTFSNKLVGAGISYHSGDDFIRVWYASSGGNVALATYICDWEHRFAEADECESILKSLRFTSSE
jgi:hypothetical protein